VVLHTAIAVIVVTLQLAAAGAAATTVGATSRLLAAVMAVSGTSDGSCRINDKIMPSLTATAAPPFRCRMLNQ